MEFEHVTKRYTKGLEAITGLSRERRAKALAPPPAPRADDGVGQRASARHGRLATRLRRLQMRPHGVGRKLAHPRETDSRTMRLKPPRCYRKQRDAGSGPSDAYLAWREQCVAVRTAYLAWRRARAAEAALAFDAYEAALKREEAAAEAYAALMRRVGPLVETGLARLPVPPEHPRSADVSATSGRSPRPPGAPAAGGGSRTAFVLSGGASLGAMQVGMLHALSERGIVPDQLVATRWGRSTPPRRLATTDRCDGPRTRPGLAQSAEREDIFPVSMSALVGGCCGRRTTWSRIAGCASLRRYLASSKSLPSATIPLRLVAFELIEGRELLLSDGPASDSIIAAAAIPGVFPPGPDRRALVERRWRGQQHADLTRARAWGGEDLRAPDSAPGQPASVASAQCARHRHVRAWIAERHSASKRHRSVLGRG